MTAPILSNGWRVPAGGLGGGVVGVAGINGVQRTDDRVERIDSISSTAMGPGDVFAIGAPGGCGCGEPG